MGPASARSPHSNRGDGKWRENPQVKRTKEILSANTDAPLSVEELHNGLDFRSTITRSPARPPPPPVSATPFLLIVTKMSTTKTLPVTLWFCHQPFAFCNHFPSLRGSFVGHPEGLLAGVPSVFGAHTCPTASRKTRQRGGGSAGLLKLEEQVEEMREPRSAGRILRSWREASSRGRWSR